MFGADGILAIIYRLLYNIYSLSICLQGQRRFGILRCSFTIFFNHDLLITLIQSITFILSIFLFKF